MRNLAAALMAIACLAAELFDGTVYTLDKTTAGCIWIGAIVAYLIALFSDNEDKQTITYKGDKR